MKRYKLLRPTLWEDANGGQSCVLGVGETCHLFKSPELEIAPVYLFDLRGRGTDLYVPHFSQGLVESRGDWFAPIE